MRIKTFLLRDVITWTFLTRDNFPWISPGNFCSRQVSLDKKVVRVQTETDMFVYCHQLMKLTCNKYQWLSLITSWLLCVHSQCGRSMAVTSASRHVLWAFRDAVNLMLCPKVNNIKPSLSLYALQLINSDLVLNIFFRINFWMSIKGNCDLWLFA